jgi:hypothetical protein
MTRGHRHLPEDDERLPWPPDGIVICPRCGQGLLILRRITHTDYWVHPDRMWEPDQQDQRASDVHIDMVFCNNTACDAEWKSPRWNPRLQLEVNPPKVEPGPICYELDNQGALVHLLLNYLYQHAPHAYDSWLRAWPEPAARLAGANFFSLPYLFDDLESDAVTRALTDLIGMLDAISPEGHCFGVKPGTKGDWGYWPGEPKAEED